MVANNLGGALAAGVIAIAVLNTLASLSMPVRDRAPGLPLIVTWLLLLSVHAALYWRGERIRGRLGVAVYAIAQAGVLFSIAVTRAPTPVTVGLFMACTAELVLQAGAMWGTVRITIGAIALFVLASLITSDLYRATTAGLLLAVTGVIAHAIAALVRRPSPPGDGAATLEAQPAPVANAASGLSAREVDVLRELVAGARNNDIAAKLGITERTVKSHLSSIYRKLGVESRSAAVAAAMQRKLI